MKTKCLAIGIILLFVGTCIIPAIAQNTRNESSSRGNWLYVGGNGSGNYTKIQDAINASSDGDTVFVFDGTYYENVIVTKSINMIGASKNGTIIDGKEKGHVINITATNVTIIGFTIENTSDIGSGVQICANNSIVLKNVIKDFYYGIEINSYGTNIISENILQSYLAIGIDLLHSSQNIITNNTIILTEGGGGISLYGASNNTMKDNYIDRGTCYISHSSNNNIYLNNSIQNQGGIYIFAASCYNVIAGNRFCNETWNQKGIRIEGSNSNKIYHNHFINNWQNVYDNGNNSWDDGYPSGGNFWDDYTANDYDNDGVGDSPYNISGGNNVDWYPLGYFDYEPPILTIVSPVEGFLYYRHIQLLPLSNITVFLGKMMFIVNVSDAYFKDVYNISIYVDGEYIGGVGGINKPYNITISRKGLIYRDFSNIFKHKYTIRFEAVDIHKNIASKELIVWTFF